MPRAKKAPQAAQPDKFAQIESSATSASLVDQRNMFANNLAVANGKLAVAHARIAELEQALKATTEKNTEAKQ